ncbi:MAG TPA: hypothetical protein VJR29_07120 [bacterium]|nr:hypothetical protein [bacterium]
MNRLDGLTLNIELTLISIIQGVTLFFLVDSSRAILLGEQYFFWPYVATGLVIIFLFWSRAIIHTLTIIRWPMDFGHTFIYIVTAFIQAIAFTQVSRPSHWFALFAVLAIFIWSLFFWDLKMIERTVPRLRSPSTLALFNAAKRSQQRNVRYVLPFSFTFNVAAYLVISRWPEIFIARHWHLAFIGFQFTAASIYLVEGIHFFKQTLHHFQDAEEP